MVGKFELTMLDTVREAGLCDECPFSVYALVKARVADEEQVSDDGLSEEELLATYDDIEHEVTRRFVIRSHIVGADNLRDGRRMRREQHMKTLTSHIERLIELVAESPCKGTARIDVEALRPAGPTERDSEVAKDLAKYINAFKSILGITERNLYIICGLDMAYLREVAEHNVDGDE